MELAADYDKKILKIRKEKDKIINNLIVTRKNKIYLQRELIYRLNNIDKDLEKVRVRNDDSTLDRWDNDQGLGLPVENRPSTDI